MRPQLEYASTARDPYQQGRIYLIEKVQRRSAIYLTGRYSVGGMIDQLHWKSLTTRRKEARLTMMYKIVNNKVAIDSNK